MKGKKRYALFLTLIMTLSLLAPCGTSAITASAKEKEGKDTAESLVFSESIEETQRKILEEFQASAPESPAISRYAAEAVTDNGMEGEGTAESPYLIKTGDDLFNIPLNITAHYKLANDIDFYDVPKTPMAEFRGVLDGDGHTIRNLKINYDGGAFLFSLANYSSFQNITIQDSSFSTTGTYAAAFFGAASYATFENCNLIAVNISARACMGGFAAILDNTTVTNCHFYSGSLKSQTNISGSFAGAFFDQVSHSTLSNCSASIDVDTPEYTYVGGLIGTASNTTLSQCFSNSTLKGKGFIGGLIGVDYKETRPTTKINDCYSTGELLGATASTVCSGLMGEVQGGVEIKNSYSSNKLPNNTAKFGLANDAKSTVTNSYFDKAAAGLTAPAGQARTQAQMQQVSNYVGWNFDTIWFLDAGKDYPKLAAVPDADLPVQSVTVAPGLAAMKTGETLQFRAIITPANAANRKVSWISSNPAVLTVDENGLATAVTPGFAAIAVHTEDGCHIGFSNITVEQNIPVIPVESVSITPETLTLEVGSLEKVTTTVLPANATNLNFTLTSSDANIAAVDVDGNVTAVAPGTCTITATTEDGGHTAVCQVTVNALPPQNIALQATATSNNESSSTYRASMANDGDPETRWLSRSNAKNVYLELDFGKQMTFSKVKLNELSKRIDSYALQIWDGTVWVDIHTGNEVGPGFEVDFDTVTSDKIRLMVYTTLGTYGPSIYEFEVY